MSDDEAVEKLAAQIRTATVIHAGDRVLLTTTEADPSLADAGKLIIDGLERRFEGVTFSLVAGVSDVAVQR